MRPIVFHLSGIIMSCIFANSHYGLNPADVAVFLLLLGGIQIRLDGQISCVIPVVYYLSRNLIDCGVTKLKHFIAVCRCLSVIGTKCRENSFSSHTCKRRQLLVDYLTLVQFTGADVGKYSAALPTEMVSRHETSFLTFNTLSTRLNRRFFEFSFVSSRARKAFIPANNCTRRG